VTENQETVQINESKYLAYQITYLQNKDTECRINKIPENKWHNKNNLKNKAFNTTPNCVRQWQNLFLHMDTT